VDRRNALKTAAGAVCGLIAGLFGRVSTGKTTPTGFRYLKQLVRVPRCAKLGCGNAATDTIETFGARRLPVCESCKDFFGGPPAPSDA
jgi:hypothetical protein